MMCDSVAIINRGRLIASGPVSDVLASHAGVLVVEIDAPATAVRVLADRGFASRIGEQRDTVVVEAPRDRAAEVTKALADAGHYLRGLRVESASLESVFLELTQDHEAQ